MTNDNVTVSAGSAIFGKLGALGVDYVFVNSGTDFPPVIEGLLEARDQDVSLPTPITVPHEHVAVGMAHGYYQISGRPQAVMLHTNVGLANGVIGSINASCDQIPMLLMSGRTPVTEKDRFGARTVPIGWGQEMYDQGAMVREVCKWKYELRFPEQTPELLDRAWAISMSTPKGPSYLELPREVLCEQISTKGVTSSSSMQPVIASPEPEQLRAAAKALAQAKKPLIINQRGSGSEEAFHALADFVDRWAIPVSHYWSNQVSIPMSHPMQIGVNPDTWLAEADVVLVINSLAPWWPDHVSLRDDVTVIQMGPDPLFARTPIRNFQADITLIGEVAPSIVALAKAVDQIEPDRDMIKARYQTVQSASETTRKSYTNQALTGDGSPMSKEWVSLCLSRAIKAQSRKASVFHELGCPLGPLNLDEHQSYFQEPHSGGLGWGFPAALGAQLADPARLVFATIGDGSYMFANPTACHLVAEAHQLPVIVLVLNNEEWGAVRHSAQGLYKDGRAAKANDVPLTSLQPSPDFALTAQASRAYTETITSGEALPAALDRAIEVATTEKRQVLLNIAIARTSPH